MSGNGHASIEAAPLPPFETLKREAHESGSRCQEVQHIADRLAREFTAPIGILDPAGRAWRLVLGADLEDFPPPGPQLFEIAGSGALRLGRAVVWHPRDDPGRVWLLLPIPCAEILDLVAFAGFQRQPGDGVQSAPSPGWGPVCPDRALQAWGQKIVNQLRGAHETHVFPAAATVPPSGDDESDRLVIGRLIRRMRISDPPPRFQELATGVLKTSLGMEAVAWVPAEGQAAIVVSGRVEGLHPNAYRALVPHNLVDSSVIVNEAARDGRESWAPRVRRFAAVAAGTSGHLIAVNPEEDRLIGASEVERMQYAASLIATQFSNAYIYAELKDLLFGIIRSLIAAIDAKDRRTSGHSERVARIAVRLAEELGIPPQKRSNLYLAGLLHDIGKIGINDSVLLKEGPLTPEEHKIIQSHVEIGVTILRDLKKLRHILPGVRHHHESLDGSGYPDRLSGDQIPMEARILAVADSFDAMSSDRPYRKRLTTQQVLDNFRKGRGVQWDPVVVDALFACRMDLEAIRQKGLGESLIGAVNVTLGRT